MANINNIVFPALTLVLLAVSASSCNDFLDEQPTNASNANNAIRTTQDAQVAVNGIMRQMTSSQYYGRNFILYGDAKGGDLTICATGRGQDALYTFNHTASSGSYSGFWEQMYNVIMQANNLLENIEKLTKDSNTSYNYYKGQALTARAMVNFDLVRLYGMPYSCDRSSYGVPDVTTTLQASAKPTRSTVEQNYSRILADLQQAQQLMAADKSKHNGYIDYYTNVAEQARVKLYMEDFDGALAAAQEIINSKQYQLYTNDNWASSWSKKFGSESIFELGIDITNDLGANSLGYYLMRRGQRNNASGNFVASDYYLARLALDSADVRWSLMDQDETSTASQPRLGSCYKYLGDTSITGDGETSVTAVNIKVIRLSEIYLIAAEAALRSSMPDKELAASYLNAIRSRAPQLEPATAASITLDMILDERSKELFCEGQRFFDMMRCNQTVEFNDDFQGVPVSTRSKTVDRTFGKIVLPIPQAEINANHAIENQQNPAYK